MKLNKDDIYGLTGSLIFHAIIFLVLWMTVLKAEIPEDDGGILVNFGNVDASAGTFEPKYTGQELPQETTTTPPPAAKPVEEVKEELVTQDLEESVSLNEEKKKKEEKKKNASARLKPRKSAKLKKSARRNRQSKTRLQVLSVSVRLKATTRATLVKAAETRAVRSATATMEQTKVWAVMAHSTLTDVPSVSAVFLVRHILFRKKDASS